MKDFKVQDKRKRLPFIIFMPSAFLLTAFRMLFNLNYHPETAKKVSVALQHNSTEL